MVADTCVLPIPRHEQFRTWNRRARPLSVDRGDVTDYTAAENERAVVIVAVSFSLFAFWGTGAEPVAWGFVLLAIGYVLRIAMHRMNSTRAPVTGTA